MVEMVGSGLGFSESESDFVTFKCDLEQIRASLSLRLLKCKMRTIVFKVKGHRKNLIVLPM